MGTQANQHDNLNDDELPAEIDFSRAKARGIEVGQVVDELLKEDVELIEAVR